VLPAFGKVSPDRKIAVAAGTRNINRTGKIGRTVLAILVAVAVAAFVGFGARYLRAPSPADVERGMQAAKDMPLVGLVVAENPALEERLRAAIVEELRNPGQTPSPGAAFGVELRQRYIVPSLLASDDDSALKAVAGMEQLAKHLQMKDPILCKEFGLVGLQNADKLDGDGKVLLEQALALQEAAYRNGKGKPAKPALTTAEVAGTLTDADYGEKDLAQLNTVMTLSPADACAAIIKLYAAASALPPPRNGTLARWLLTVGQ
jgi:hypothetical protein